MRNSLKKHILAIVVALSCATAFSYAQSADIQGMPALNAGIKPVLAEATPRLEIPSVPEFKLNSQDKEAVQAEGSALPVASAFISEYKLSLGSQMLSYQNSSPVFPSKAMHIDTGFRGVSAPAGDYSGVEDVAQPLGFGNSVITLNNSYEDNAIGFNEFANSNLTLSGKISKLSFAGKFNQTSMTLTAASKNTARDSVDSSMTPVRASISIVTAGAAMGGITPAEGTQTSLSSDYYLEAVYNFKPTFKGKVAFKKTIIDTFDSKENVAVEGIVDATSDVSIKAGYSNEIRPEVETKTPKEKKVWTEFILKF